MAKEMKVALAKMMIIGGSAGGLKVLLEILPYIGKIDYPIVVVLHRRSSDSGLADLLATRTGLKVKEVEEKLLPQPSTLYVVPGDYHLLFEHDGSFSLDYSEKVNHSRPSIDVVFQSAAKVFRDKLACILLSGANADGVAGLRYAKQHGGTTIAQLPASAEVAFMPQQAIAQKVVDHIMDPGAIAAFICAY